MGTIGTNRVARENGDNWDKQKVVPRVAAGYAQRLKIMEEFWKKLTFYISHFHMKRAPPMNTFDFLKY